MKQYYSFFTLPFVFSTFLILLPTANTITYQVTGTLVNKSEAPVADHQVFLYNAEDERIASDISDNQGRFTLAYQVEPTSADPFGGPDTPSEFKLGSSYPNPFNPHTTVPFHAPENTRPVIAIYNILGQEVMRTQAELSAGSHEIAVNLGGRLSQGQYLLRVQGDGFSLTQSMTFVSAGISSGTPGITVRSGGGTRSSIGTGSDIRANMVKDSGTRSSIGTHGIATGSIGTGSIGTGSGGGIRSSMATHSIGTHNIATHSIATGSRALDTPEMYRIVVEGSDAFEEKQIEVPARQNYDAGTIDLTHTDTVVVEVTSVTGLVWMDRNLGASRAAISSTDEQSYGDLYQWGRLADGHQIIHRFEGDGKTTSGLTGTLSSSDQPGHGSFILAPNNPSDWRSPQNNNLWQGTNGTNNPCPAGYRLPTDAEWNAERNSWSSITASGALNSPLKLPMAGYRYGRSGSLRSVGSRGVYWSSTVSGSFARLLYFYNSDNSGDARMFRYSRALGVSVRCLEDDTSPEPDTYTLSLAVSPPEGGSVSGAGEYAEGVEITIAASSNTGYAFTHWSGDTDHIADGNADSTTVTMPAGDISLTANFEQDPGDTDTVVVEVTSVTGLVWMDRNLGASRAAISSTDEQSYGDLYQWGRLADGHQIIHRFEGDGKTTSGTTVTLSNTDQPGHGSFILSNSGANWDWRSSQNNNLWQGIDGVNNPCPDGYRLPTESEWNAERSSWGSSNAAGAITSALKLPMPGFRDILDGKLDSVGSYAGYWSSTISSSRARFLYFGSGAAYMNSTVRAYGYSVRCLKE